MAATVAAFEAKTKLAELLDRVEAGETSRPTLLMAAAQAARGA